MRSPRREALSYTCRGMAKRKVKKELDAPEAFEEALRDELAVSADFDLPLSALALRVGEGFEPETVRRALEAVRVADLICQPEPHELLVILPNTKAEDARVVEERLRTAAPEAAFGVTVRAHGDTVETLLKRARAAATTPEPS